MREIKKRGKTERQREHTCAVCWFWRFTSTCSRVTYMCHLSCTFLFGFWVPVIWWFFFSSPQCRTLCAVSFTQLPRITLLQGSPTHTAHCCTRHLVPRCFNLFVSVGLWLTCFINKFSQCFRFAPLMSGLLLFVYFGIRKTFCHAYFCFHAQVFILDAHIHTHSKIYFVNVMYYFEGNLSDDF